MKILPLYLPQQGCPHQCVYCNQPLIVNSPAERDQWRNRLERLYQADPASKWEIAFYGGTFSALPHTIMENSFKEVQPYLSLPHVSGIRISTRPDCLNDEILDYLKANQVTTIELGGESFDDPVLRKIGRGHSSTQFKEACTKIKNADIQLGLHLMCGLPEQSEESWQGTVETAVQLRPDMVRFAPTLILKGTPLEKLYQRGTYFPQPYQEALEQCAYAYQQFFRNSIPMIRVGLALSDTEGNGTEKIIAGPWHPAFRHEVESYLARRTILSAICHLQADTTIRVNPRDLLITQGSRRCNLAYWRVQWGQQVSITCDGNQPRYTFQIGDNSSHSLFIES